MKNLEYVIVGAGPVGLVFFTFARKAKSTFSSFGIKKKK